MSSELRMCLQKCSGKGRWSGWTCSATGTNGWSRDLIRWVSFKKIKNYHLKWVNVFFPGSGSNTVPGLHLFESCCSLARPRTQSNKMTGERLIAQGRDFPRGAASLPVELVFKPRDARSSSRLPLCFHESAAGQDVTHPSISPRTMRHIDSLGFSVGVAQMRRPCVKGAVQFKAHGANIFNFLWVFFSPRSQEKKKKQDFDFSHVETQRLAGEGCGFWWSKSPHENETSLGRMHWVCVWESVWVFSLANLCSHV